MLKRTLLDRSILPLLEANQARFHGFGAFERVYRGISSTFHRNLQEVEVVGLLCCRINEDRPAQCILGEALADSITEAVKDWLTRVEKNSFLVLAVWMIQGAGLACLRRVAFQVWQQPIKLPRFERAEGKGTLDIALDANINKRRGIFQEATDIAR